MRGAGIVVVVALAGCTYQMRHGPGSQHVGLRSGPHAGVQASLSDRGLYGPSVSLLREHAGYRGQVLDQSVNLSWDDHQVKGLANTASVNLRWKEEGQVLHINGLYAGMLTNLRVSDEALEGSLGPCSYQLRWDGGSYFGDRSCGGELQRFTSVELPGDLTSRPMGERVALVALILSPYRATGEYRRSAEFQVPWGFDTLDQPGGQR
jgi:hypothetical protein